MSGEGQQNCGSGELENSTGDRAKPRLAPMFLDLTRCAACYDQKGRSMPRHRGDSESSSEVSDREAASDSDSDSNSDSDTSSSSSSSEAASRPGANQKAPAPGSPAPGPRPPDPVRDHASETIDQGALMETSAAGREAQRRQEQKREEMRMRDVGDMKTALLSSPSHRLFSRPPSVVSTLHLQAVPGNHGDVTVYTQAGYSGPE